LTKKPSTTTLNTSSSVAATAKRAQPGVVRPSTSTVPLSKRPKLASAVTPAQSMESRMKEIETISQQLQKQVDALHSQLGDRETQLEQVSQVKSSLMEDVSTYSKEINESHMRNKELMKLMEETETRHQMEVDGLQSKLMLTSSRLESSELSLKQLRGEAARMTITMQQQTDEIEALKTSLMSTQTSLKKSEDLAATRAQKIDDLEEQLAQAKASIAELEEKAREDEDTRRHLHNAIQELKGNIRVFCRVRPGSTSSSSSDSDDVRYAYSKMDDGALDITQKQSKDVTGCKNAPDKKHSFHFDRVFQPSSTQSQVFAEISQLVQSALDGYNTCIFAYGQTGSGKTYTMEGPEAHLMSPETEGMISRAVQQIFVSSNRLREKGWEYEMYASFLEIYNETIRDLLDPKHADTKKCDVKHDAETGATSVSNLLVLRVRTPEKVADLLSVASKNRAVGSTNMNLRSSRSHSVFQLKLVGKNTVSGAQVEGLLNLIDLAGSERLATSGAQGDRLTETKNINKSLSCLGDVISALANKDKHVPFRNSKLTYLLQNSLGGNSKTLMFVNISPSPENISETLNSLRFASKVNACEIGTARKGGKVDLSS
jgi:kinesin family protein C1